MMDRFKASKIYQPFPGYDRKLAASVSRLFLPTALAHCKSLVMLQIVAHFWQLRDIVHDFELLPDENIDKPSEQGGRVVALAFLVAVA